MSLYLRIRQFLFIAACACIVAIAVMARGQAAPSTQPFKPIPDQSHLHNAHVVTANLISGAEPEGDEGFKTLRDLGVKTIISVDGATPDVDAAKKYGMRYVHIPITYSTVTSEQGEQIAKALEEMPGLIYLHCHHGKHRSAAAVAVACVLGGQLKPDQAELVLKTFGTGANYTGLWKAAREAKPVDPKVIKDLKVEFVEKVQIPPLADAMVDVDHHTDHLKLIQTAGWAAPKDYPDLDPSHEALQLQEHFTELGRNDAMKAKPENFRNMLLEGEKSASALREVLAAKPINKTNADTAIKRVLTSCTACHAAYRD